MYVFKQLWVKVTFSGMHPKKEFQNRGTEHMHVPIHIVDAAKIDENVDSEVVEFIDKYINVLYLTKNTLKLVI